MTGENTLDQHTFVAGGETYAISAVKLVSGTLSITLDKAPNDALKAMTLKVGSSFSRSLSDKTSSTLSWSSTGLTWTAFRFNAQTESNYPLITISKTVPTGTIWAAELVVQEPASAYLGCDSAVATAASKCLTVATLERDWFHVDDSDDATADLYGISHIRVAAAGESNAGDLQVKLVGPAGDASVNTALQALNFCVGTQTFAIPDSASGTMDWTSAGVSWSAGDRVELSIGSSCPQPPDPNPWSGTLTVRDLTDANTYGCSNTESGQADKCSSALTDDDFTLSGTTWEIQRAFATFAFPGGTRDRSQDGLTVRFNNDAQTALDAYNLCVGTTPLAFSAASHTVSNNQAGWNTTAVSDWSAGDTVELSIATSCAAAPTVQAPPTDLAVTPGDAQLTMSWTAPGNVDDIFGYDLHFTSADVADVADDAVVSGTDTPAVGWVETEDIVGQRATSYTIDSDDATLTNGTTYRVRLRVDTPESAYVYSSGTPSASAATAIWSATLTAQRIVSSFRGCDNTGAGAVKCSAAATLTDDDFTLSSTDWEITGIQSDGSRMTVFFNQDVRTALDSYSFCVGATAFAFSDATHGGGNDSARWTTGVPTWTTGDTVALSINSASCAQQAVQAPPTDLAVTPGDGTLEVSWTAPGNVDDIFGYDLHFTSADVADVADDAVVSGTDTPAVGWVETEDIVGQRATSYTIDSDDATLTNGTTYRVRLRVDTPESAYVYSSGTPTAAVTLVSNFGQQQGANYGSNGWVNAQAFTTGSNAAGYTLSAIEALLERAWADSTERGTVRAELWSAASGGAPDQKLADLTVPASHVATAMSFAAPANTALTANTAYFLVLYTTGTYNMGIDHVLATGEDSGAAAGWSIADDRYAKQSQTPAGAAAWGSHSNPLRITVKGTAAQTALFSANANLSGLTASTATSSGGPYSALTIGAFMASTQSYTATVANARTHLTLTPTVADTGKATVGVRKGNAGSFTPVADGTASSAIALDLGSNAITVRVTAEDRKTTRDYTVTVTRQTQAALPAVTLSASPNPVSEGAGVTVTARLSEALSSMVTIPLTITDNTAEPEDHGTVTGILINAGATSGTGTITTSQDPDEDDETFTVALGTLPATVEAGTPDRVLIRILDDDRDAPDFTELAGLTGSASTDGADFGGTLTLEPAFDPRTVEYTARVAAAATHVRLTAAADFAAYDVVAVNTRTVEGVYASSTTLTAASPSADFALDAGTTNLRLVVDDKAAVLSTRSYNVSVVGGTTPRDPGGGGTPPGGGGGVGGGGGGARNQAPEATADIAEQVLDVGADAQLDLTDHFRDPERRDMTFAAESANTAIATVTVTDDGLAVQGVAHGATTVTVTATDHRGLTATQTFTVTVGWTVGFATAQATAAEGDSATLTVALNRVRETDTTVAWVVGADADPATADADAADHDAADGMLTIAAGALEATLEIAVHDDADIEPAREWFTLTLQPSATEPAPWGLGAAVARLAVAEGVCDRTRQVRNALRRSRPCDAVDDADLAAVRTLDVSGTELETIQAADLLQLDGLLRLDLSDNLLTELPAGLFVDRRDLLEVHAHDNPGAPFALGLTLHRINGAPWAPGPAHVVLRVREGAPFEFEADVSATAGRPSRERVRVAAGRDDHWRFWVWREGRGITRVSAMPADVPATRCGAPSDDYPCFRGLTLPPPEPLALFKRPPRLTGDPPEPEVGNGGDSVRIDLGKLFRGAERDEPLTCAATVRDADLVTATLDGCVLTLTSSDDGDDGATTVTLTVTDADGQTTTLTFEVEVTPLPRGLLRGVRRVILLAPDDD